MVLLYHPLTQLCKSYRPICNIRYLSELKQILAVKTRPICNIRYLSELKQILAVKTQKRREKIAKFRKEHGNFKVGEVTINTMYGGMRGLLALVYETSNVDPKFGVTFRGLPIPEIRKKLPKAKGGDEPLPEGVFWLILASEIPNESQVKALSCDWAARSELPPFIRKMLNDMPKDMHPMRQLTCAITALGNSSKFNRAYNKGVKKTEYWEWIYEDCMDLLAKLPVVAATIYVNTYRGGGKDTSLKVDPDLDWSANYARMMCFDSTKFDDLMRLYLSIHCDHEGGNVSAHTMHLVGSALSDPYLSYAAGMNGLAGPLHGLANQEVLIWLTKMQKEIGKDPSDEKVKEYCEKTLKSGRVIPGYGHAVLRVTDPRFTCQQEYAKKHLPNDPMFKLVTQIFKVVPPILKATGKVQNPYPNVDAHSGVLLQHFGMKEMNYYTVLFAVSRALGGCASLILSRELGLPIERPKSRTTKSLMEMVQHKAGKGKDDKKGKCDKKGKGDKKGKK